MDPGVTGVVVAAGSSRRLGGGLPKQFRRLAGRMVVEHAVACLTRHPDVRGVIVVLAPEELAGPRAARLRALPGVIEVVGGGATRSASVLSGVRAAPAGDLVLVHDAARPLAPRSLVEAVIRAALAHGAAIPALEVGDTVKEVQNDAVHATLDRGRLRLAQTPQAARREWLCRALERAAREGIEPTDEAQALERDGRTVGVVPGDPDNLKITTVRDLDRARRGLEEGEMELRVGTGFDIHASGADRPLILGGVVFPGEPGLLGHSDADVILHAAMDALLGAACLGDLGVHFPPGDPRFKDAASTDLLRQVVELVRGAGYEVVNIDLTLLAERPRIRDRAAAMRDELARCLDISADRVGLKATTLERLGALGRGEGIACQAVALLRRSPRAGS